MKESFEIKTHPYGLMNMARGNNWPLHSAVCELIDNSIDAGSTVIEIKLEENILCLQDNGSGFTYDQLINAFKEISGPPQSDDIDRIGRYNTGMKTASIRIGQTLTILTRAKNNKSGYSFSVDWNDVCNKGLQIKYPKGYDVSFLHGTVITINERFLPDKRDNSDVRYHLSKIYSRLIKEGLIINFNGYNIDPLPKIPLIIERTLKGDDYGIRFGLYEHDKVIKDTSGWRSNDAIGVHIYYRGRLFHMTREQRTAFNIPYDKYHIEINTTASHYGPNVHKDGLIYLDKILTDKIINGMNGHFKNDQSKIQDEKDIKLAQELTKMFSDIAKKNKRSDDGKELLLDDGHGRRNGKENEGPTAKGTLNGSAHKFYNKGDDKDRKHIIKSKECDLSNIQVIQGHSESDYGYASIDPKTNLAFIHLDWTTSEYASSLVKKNNKAALYYIAIAILAEEWVKQIDVRETVQGFIFKHTKELT